MKPPEVSIHSMHCDRATTQSIIDQHPDRVAPAFHLNFAFLFAFGGLLVFHLYSSTASAQRTMLPLNLLPAQSRFVRSTVDYYIDSEIGDDANDGTSPSTAWKTLERASAPSASSGQVYGPGDRILLKRGLVFPGSLQVRYDTGSETDPILISSYGPAAERPVIDATGESAGIDLSYSEFIEVDGIELIGRGVAIQTWGFGQWIKEYSHIHLTDLHIHNVEGTGINVIVRNEGEEFYSDILIADCLIEDTGSHGITINKWGADTSVDVFHHDVRIENNTISNLGDAGIQVGKLKTCLIKGNTISSPGFLDNGNGSCIWTWFCSDLVAERNMFAGARGVTDSCGIHIDIGNENVIVQHNLSVDNEGGFVEILGLCRNCVYRYNISINDGARIKGIDGALQEGKTFWLGGYTGIGKPRVGPFNSYIYNNTIFVKSEIVSKYLIEPTAEGALFANNVIYVEGDTQSLTNNASGSDIIFDNNLIFENKVPSTPFNLFVNNRDADPQFDFLGGLDASNYACLNANEIVDQGIDLYNVPGDTDGVNGGFAVADDFFGNPVSGLPDMGAIEAPPVATEIGDGSSQRSAVDSLVITYDGSLDFLPGSISMKKRSDLSGPADIPVSVSFETSVEDGNTKVEITFDDSTRDQAGSLIDGNYELHVEGDLVFREGRKLGVDFVFGDEAEENFFSLFGDGDGNRTVDVFELLAFRRTYRESVGSANFNPIFDYDSNGTVNIFDLLAFRQRYGMTLSFQ